MKSLTNTKNIILAVVILVITILLWVLPTADLGVEGMNVMQQRTLAIFVFAALMWLFEVIPAWATSVTTIVALLFAVSDKGFVLDENGVAVFSGAPARYHIQVVDAPDEYDYPDDTDFYLGPESGEMTLVITKE